MYSRGKLHEQKIITRRSRTKRVFSETVMNLGTFSKSQSLLFYFLFKKLLISVLDHAIDDNEIDVAIDKLRVLTDYDEVEKLWVLTNKNRFDHFCIVYMLNI